MTKVLIIPEENLDKSWERGFKRLAEKIRIKYPQHRYRTAVQLLPETEFSTNVENPDPRRVY
jgi:hypothetical protein